MYKTKTISINWTLIDFLFSKGLDFAYYKQSVIIPKESYDELMKYKDSIGIFPEDFEYVE